MFFGVTKFNDNPDFVEIAIFSQEKETSVGRLFFLCLGIWKVDSNKAAANGRKNMPVACF